MRTHLDKGHLIAFDTHEELSQHVGGEPILSKIGLIEKVRNGKKKIRMTLDTKQSRVKLITGKAHRAT